MAFDPSRNPNRNRYVGSIEDHAPPAVIVHVLKLHAESNKPLSNLDVQHYLVRDARVSRAAGKLHTDKTNACEQAELLERISERPTLRRITDKGRRFYERHRHLL
jgi:hypothetical protein